MDTYKEFVPGGSPMGHKVTKDHHVMLLKCCMMTLIMAAKETKITCATRYTTLKGFR